MATKTAQGAAELTPRQSRFIDEYLLEPNATQAAIKAGYAKGSATVTGARLLANANVCSILNQRMEERAKRTQIDSDYVLHRLGEIDQLDVLDVLTDEGDLKPISEWPKVWRQSISGADLMSLQSGDETINTVVKKIKWPDKLKTLELIGKHNTVRAFDEAKDTTDQTVADSLARLADKLPG